MHRILFICHGNICRSTMAQFVMDELVRRACREDEFVIDSAATSREEIGNPPHHGTVRKLNEVGIPVGRHRARQARRDEYDDWDLIVYMDRENLRGLWRIFGEDSEGKFANLLSFVPGRDGSPCCRAKGSDCVGCRYGCEVADPWYTGNFDDTYRDVLAGCSGLLEFLS